MTLFAKAYIQAVASLLGLFAFVISGFWLFGATWLNVLLVLIGICFFGLFAAFIAVLIVVAGDRK